MQNEVATTRKHQSTNHNSSNQSPDYQEINDINHVSFQYNVIFSLIEDKVEFGTKETSNTEYTTIFEIYKHFISNCVKPRFFLLKLNLQKYLINKTIFLELAEGNEEMNIITRRIYYFVKLIN